ncbi:acetyl-coenzyme A carboxylase carboxyl transferase subunit alpha, chloroplastic isoform X2 [Elaeis guineensis]|uniref:acetyl-coenzyme A carboxylase carboxyl transferase subunit alpha, chloroplastic isoform X2 n=1 Tax=Elaeis guineensis var. tenera TaxID=51953 RepID=UPI003C6DB2A6
MASVSLFGASVSDPLWSSCNGVSGVPLKSLGRSRKGTRKSLSAAVAAKIKKVKKHDYPWPDEIDPNVKGGYLSYLSHFKPLKGKPKPVTLPFEKPLMDLEKKLIDVRKMADEMDLDFRDQIISWESKYREALKDLYTHLTPIQRLSIARHPNRPTFLDHVLNITDNWVEFHGDRAGYDDPAIVTGIGSIDGRSYMFIGHQKGRNTKENIERNFGMPTPHGYRKALRMMYYADHHGLPIITFIDTPGAFADLKSEEIGQGEAIAHNLRTMFGLKVPIVTVVIGEGGSGGALAIGCANKLLMLENAVFYVASPEACAAILWKSSKAAPKAAEQLKITATELCKLKIADGVIPELLEMDTPKLLHNRMLKFRYLGGFVEGEPVDLSKKVNMKKKEEPLIQQEKPGTASDVDLEYEVEKLKQQILESKDYLPSQPSDLGLNEMIEKLKEEVDQEFAEAVESMGLKDRLEMLRKEVTVARSLPDHILDSSLTEKIEKLKQEFKQGLSEYPNYDSLNHKLDMLKELSKAQKISERNEKIMSLKHEINEGFKVVMNHPDLKEKIDKLKAEISDAGVSRTFHLDNDLKEKIFMVKKGIESELAKKLSSLHLNVELASSKREASIARDVIEHPLYSELKENIDEINDEIEEGIENAVNSTNLKNEIVMLKLEVEHAGKSADPEVKHKIESMIHQIRQSLAEAVSSPSLMEKYKKLKQKIARAKESSSGELEEGSGKYNGGLNQDAFKEGSPKLDITGVEIDID